ncbi:hypothetical protein R3X25_11540 [Lutibacter sp. TH_r2]|uniref:hypothetical protein n=1 Tax=Lutibacter sp. TH_r2 TaxID=3082083 RepID=UPI00295502D5|nr:hypothetical protein [Lutibacter sp. TH_r2]MDV7187915.1 hypothetical protein [Lutibacter sp. TH_r2]
MEFKNFEENLLRLINDYFISRNGKVGVLENSYSLNSNNYSDTVFINIGNNISKKLFRVHIGIVRRIHIIEKLWEDLETREKQNSTFGTGINQTMTTIEIDSNENDSVKKSFNFIVDNLENQLTEKLDYYSDINILDSIFNSTYDNLNVYPATIHGIWYKKLIIAKLADNPDFNLIFNYLNDMFIQIIKDKPNDKKWKERFMILKEVNKRVQLLDKLNKDIL